jgi:integrase/recombinase XerD
MRINNYSEDTADHARWSIADFIRWAEQRGMQHPMEVTRPILESYQRYLYYYRKGNGAAAHVPHAALAADPVRRWFRWLVRNNHILHNPASDLDMPRMESGFRAPILSADPRPSTSWSCPTSATPVGLRDRAILETFYSTGIRRTELINLKLYDVDRERATLTIRQGKGKKGPHDPHRRASLAWVEKYLREARPQLASEPDDGTLFLTQYGEPFHPDAMSNLARDYIEASEPWKIRFLPHVPPHHGDVDAGRRRESPLHPADARPRRPEHARKSTRTWRSASCNRSTRPRIPAQSWSAKNPQSRTTMARVTTNRRPHCWPH